MRILGMRTDFVTAGRIIFGAGTIRSLPKVIRNYGNSVFVLRSKSVPGFDEIMQSIKDEGLTYSEVIVSGEPDVDVINRTAKKIRNDASDCVLSIGGGSVMDTGKAISALLTNPGELLDYLEVVGKGLPLSNPAAPFIAVPTTAGTGSEVTKNAVISVLDKTVKVSMRSDKMLPDVALVDPSLTYSVPPEITAQTGMDAFTQVIEPYVSNQANDFVDLFCRDAIPRAGKYLRIAYKDGKDTYARENMAWVSLMGGLALANAKLGAVHGFAGPIGGMFNLPHGKICTALLPAVMKTNIKLLRGQDTKRDYLDRYEEIAYWLTGSRDTSAEEGAEWVEVLRRELNIPTLSEMGIKKKDFQKISQKAEGSSSMKGNPVQLSREEMFEILELAF